MSVLYKFESVSYIAPPKEKGSSPLTILNDATFTIPSGTFAILTGPSGSGKSTLLRLFNRLADAAKGSIYFNGRKIEVYPVLELRRRIGWVPQVPVRFPGSVIENLRLPFTLS